MTSPEKPATPQQTTDGKPDAPNQSPAVWSYRGYRLDNRDFTTAMVHFYRGEMSRANLWRNRLDVTTNWALVATGAAITFAFGESNAHHSVILLDYLLVTLCLVVEARRYRYFELWSNRVRLIETNFYAPLLVPPFHPGPNWAEDLSASLLKPEFPISVWEALGRRLHYNYVWIFLVLDLAWVARLLLSPTGVLTPAVFVSRARLGLVPGDVVILVVLLFNLALVTLSLSTQVRLRRRRAEAERQASANEAKKRRATADKDDKA